MAETKRTTPQRWLLYASHAQFLAGASQRWCAEWGGGDGVETLHGTTVSLGELRSALSVLPMFRDLQVVRLTHAEEAEDEVTDEVARWLAKPSPTTALLVECCEDLSAKRVSKRWANFRDTFPASRDCSAKSVRAYVGERARAEGFRVSPPALEALEEWANRDLSLLPGAVDLLFLYRAVEKVVEEEDVESLLGAGGTPKLWTLQDALLTGDRVAFLDVLAGLERDPDQAPLAFVGMLSKQMRHLLALHGLTARGLSRREIDPKQVDSKLLPFQLGNLFGALPKWPEARVRKTLGVLYELDLAIKGDPGSPWGQVERRLLALF
jgi:DNA polymerase III delta subunit